MKRPLPLDRGGNLHRRRFAQEVLAGIDTLPWEGKAGGNRRAVLTALLGKAARLASLEFDISVRELAVLSGLSPPTARRHLDWLEENKLIERVLVRRSGDLAARWSVRTPTLDRIRRDRNPVIRSVMPDAFRTLVDNKGLPKRDLQVLEILLTSRQTPDALAKTLPLGLAHTRRILRRLEVLGLVQVQQGVWEAIDLDLAELAVRMGTDGATEAQERRIEAERQAWDVNRDERISDERQKRREQTEEQMRKHWLEGLEKELEGNERTEREIQEDFNIVVGRMFDSGELRL